jgi:tetratricopeptide (TPR) repeat protein
LELAELRSRLGDFREAERLYSMAVRQRDQAPEAYKARALMRRHQGKRDEALEDLRAAIALRPGDVDSVRELARWYVEQRAWTAALSQYRALVRVLSETGSTPELQQARLQVRALTIMAAETDPVSEGGTSKNWIRKSMSKLAAQ